MYTAFRMTAFWAAFTTLLFVVLSPQVFASTPEVITGVEQRYSLLEPSENKRDFDTVRGLPEDQWQSTSVDVLNFALDKREHWLKITLKNTDSEQKHLTILLDQPIQDYIDFWLVGNTGKLQQHYKTGDRLPFNSRPMDFRGFAFPVELPATSSVDVFFRFDTYDGLYEAIPVYIQSHDEFRQWIIQDSLWYGFYYGALTILLAYNLIIGFLTKERDFYLYSLYLGTFFIWNLLFRGYGYQHLWPDNPWFANQILSISVSFIFITLTAFTAVFLDLKRQAPRLHRLILVLTGLQLVPIFLTLGSYYTLFFTTLMPIASMHLLAILSAAIYLSYKKSQPAQIFTLAWGVLIASVLIYFAQVLGAIPANSLTSNILNIGSLIEMLVLALAMVDKINQMKQDQAKALKANLIIQQENNIELEQLVAEKTAQLTALNKQLEHDAITDALTGLFNRRRLPRLYEKRLEHCSQHDEFIGFILLDIDHFKQINDKFGHQDGDEVLVKLTECMRAFWLEWQADLFRFGGEEFGIIICHKDRPLLTETIKSFQHHISQQTLHHTRNITISVGAVIMPSQNCPDLDKAIAVADGLLYDAKNQGRDLCLIKSLAEEVK